MRTNSLKSYYVKSRNGEPVRDTNGKYRLYISKPKGSGYERRYFFIGTSQEWDDFVAQTSADEIIDLRPIVVGRSEVIIFKNNKNQNKQKNQNVMKNNENQKKQNKRGLMIKLSANFEGTMIDLGESPLGEIFDGQVIGSPKSVMITFSSEKSDDELKDMVHKIEKIVHPEMQFEADEILGDIREMAEKFVHSVKPDYGNMTDKIYRLVIEREIGNFSVQEQSGTLNEKADYDTRQSGYRSGKYVIASVGNQDAIKELKKDIEDYFRGKTDEYAKRQIAMFEKIVGIITENK